MIWCDIIWHYMTYIMILYDIVWCCMIYDVILHDTPLYRTLCVVGVTPFECMAFGALNYQLVSQGHVLWKFIGQIYEWWTMNNYWVIFTVQVIYTVLDSLHFNEFHTYYLYIYILYIYACTTSSYSQSCSYGGKQTRFGSLIVNPKDSVKKDLVISGAGLVTMLGCWYDLSGKVVIGWGLMNHCHPGN